MVDAKEYSLFIFHLLNKFFKILILYIFLILGFISILIVEILILIIPSIIKSFLLIFYFLYLEFCCIFKNNSFKEK